MKSYKKTGRNRLLPILLLLAASLILSACEEDLTAEQALALAPNPANTSVLVLIDSAAGRTAAAGFLPAFGFPVVDTWDTSTATPTVLDLLNYDAVLFSSNTFELAPIAVGDAVADYIDAGGGVVTTTPSHGPAFGAAGRITTSGQSPFNFDATADVGASTLGAVLLPGHFIMTNVLTVSASGRDDPTLAPGGILIADWADGFPMAAVNTSGTVAGITLWLDTLNGGNFDQLIANALAFTAFN